MAVGQAYLAFQLILRLLLYRVTIALFKQFLVNENDVTVSDENQVDILLWPTCTSLSLAAAYN